MRSVFRDSRGVVHTVSSADPLDDLPAEAADALARTLLVAVGADLGSALERCEAVGELLDEWQDAFFAALPEELDLEEESRWAAEAGLTLAEVEADWEDDDLDDDLDAGDSAAGRDGGEPALVLDAIDLDELTPLPEELAGLVPPAPERRLPEHVIGELEVMLLLLPLRVRLEALVAAGSLVDGWADLLADHEKALGHLVLGHGEALGATGHEQVVDRHAALHDGRAAHARVVPPPTG